MSITIRGIDVENRTNYRLNGMLPIVNLIDLPLEDKDRVEVLKGASALYYGLTTPGGIVAAPNLSDHLYTYAWFVTFGLSASIYLLLTIRDSPRSSRNFTAGTST